MLDFANGSLQGHKQGWVNIHIIHLVPIQKYIVVKITNNMNTGYIVGVFDLFHSGHEYLINRVLKLCDKLIIGVHTDDFVESYKRRPKQTTDERLAIIRTFYPNTIVESVGGSHIELVKKYNITSIYHGDDWPEEPYKRQIGYYRDGMDQLNVKIVLLTYTRGISTTKLIQEASGATYSHYIFDLDRTLILKDTAMPFAVDLVNKLQSSNKKISVVTNNNRYTPADISAKLQNAGMNIPEKDIHSSLRAVATLLKQKFNKKKIFAWGTKDARSWLEKEGITLTEDDVCDVVVVLYNNCWAYQDLVSLCNRVKQAETYIIGNIDFLYPDSKDILPDTGSIIKLIEYCTDKKPDICCGKSSGNIVSKELLVDSVMIGDSITTDAVFAYQNNIPFLHVSSVDPRAKYSHLGVVINLHT